MGLHAVLLMHAYSGSDYWICTLIPRQKRDPSFAVHLHLTGLAYKDIRPCFPAYLVVRPCPIREGIPIHALFREQ